MTSPDMSSISARIGVIPIPPAIRTILSRRREEDVIFREELEELARGRGITLVFVVGDHATEDGARLLSPAHLQELVPDIAERQVYVCSPPAMTEFLGRNVRRANVSPRLIHTEKFAL